MKFTNNQVTNGITIQNANGSLIGGDKSVLTQGAPALDVQSQRDAAILAHLFWNGTILSAESADGGARTKIIYHNDDPELANGDIVTIVGTAYDGEYTVEDAITDVENSFEIAVTFGATATGTWSAEPLYLRLRPDENKMDSSWALEAQTSFFAEAADSLTLGKRNKTLLGWGGDWSGAFWGTCIGYQNIAGGKGTTVIGNNNIAENWWSCVVGDHNHISEWATRAFGNWNIGQGGDGLLLGSYNDTYGWKNIAIGTENAVKGNENQAHGDGNTIHDAYDTVLNETPDDVHNRFNIAMGNGNTIGSEADLGFTIDNAITIGADNTVEVDGGVAIGKGLTNLFANSIELGASNTSKIAVRSDGRFVFPSPLSGGTAPVLADIPSGHATMWYDDTNAAEKLFIYRNNGGIIEKCQIGIKFVTA